MEEYKEWKKELDKAHKKLVNFVKENIEKSKHKQFYELLTDVIHNEVEIEQFCNQ